jgi:hypothetical protein
VIGAFVIWTEIVIGAGTKGVVVLNNLLRVFQVLHGPCSGVVVCQ